MVQVISKSDKGKSVSQKLFKENKNPKKGFDADKYCGIINWDIDPVKYQREARKDRIETSD